MQTDAENCRKKPPNIEKVCSKLKKLNRTSVLFQPAAPQRLSSAALPPDHAADMPRKQKIALKKPHMRFVQDCR
jgi:hypothetical protein